MTAPSNAWRGALLDDAYGTAVLTRMMRSIRLEADGCWNWQGWKDTTGYGKVSVKRYMRPAHTVMKILQVGIWPTALIPDHLCRNRACVNPHHQELVTPSANASRGLGPANGSQHKRDKTHCPQGHPYSGANLITNDRGHRSCRACRDERNRRRDRRRHI